MFEKFFTLPIEKECQTCAVYKEQIERMIYEHASALERANYEKDRLLDSILHKPEEAKQVSTDDLVPIHRGAKHIPWPSKRKELEENDRAEAKIRKEQEDNQRTAVAQTIDKLEEEIIPEIKKEGTNGN